MKKERQRAAHLGRVTVGGESYTVTFRGGWLQFRRYRGRGRAHGLDLKDIYRLAAEQKLFAFIP